MLPQAATKAAVPFGARVSSGDLCGIAVKAPTELRVSGGHLAKRSNDRGGSREREPRQVAVRRADGRGRSTGRGRGRTAFCRWVCLETALSTSSAVALQRCYHAIHFVARRHLPRQRGRQGSGRLSADWARMVRLCCSVIVWFNRTFSTSSVTRILRFGFTTALVGACQLPLQRGSQESCGFQFRLSIKTKSPCLPRWQGRCRRATKRMAW